MGTPNSFATLAASLLQTLPLQLHVQNAEVKLRATISIPCSRITLTARVESRPPERSATAFLFIRYLHLFHTDYIYCTAQKSKQCISQGHLRHFTFFDQILYRAFLIKRFMWSLCVVEYKVIRKPLVKDRFVVHYIKIMVYELFLNRPVVSFYVGVDLRAIRIGEVMRDALFFKLQTELA